MSDNKRAALFIFSIVLMVLSVLDKGHVEIPGRWLMMFLIGLFLMTGSWRK